MIAKQIHFFKSSFYIPKQENHKTACENGNKSSNIATNDYKAILFIYNYKLFSLKGSEYYVQGVRIEYKREQTLFICVKSETREHGKSRRTRVKG